MPFHYTNPEAKASPLTLPNVQTFKGYEHECTACGTTSPRFPDYYGLLYPETEPCYECKAIGKLKCSDTEAKWYWWTCLPGCLPDSDPFGPFDSEQEALGDAIKTCED